MKIIKRFLSGRFNKVEKAAIHKIKLNHRCIFILPSTRGLGFVVLIFVLFLIAFVYNNNLAYYLTFLLASVFFITILHTFKSLSGLVLSNGHNYPAFAGEAAGFDILIDNKDRDQRLNLLISLDNDLKFALGPNEKKRLTLYSATGKRGWHDMATVTLSSSYPLGLFRAWSPLRFSAKTLVYPKPNENELPFPEADGNQAQEQQRATRKKGNDDFYGLNEYQPGDSIKQIHWKAFAKGQGLFSKQYGGDPLTELWLSYDQTPGENVEERLSHLCRWIIDAEKAGIAYGLIIPGVQFQPAHGKVHYEKCLAALALF